MKYIFTLTLLILMLSISRAESIPFLPQPVPAPTSPITVDEYSGISPKEEKERLKQAAKQIKDYENQFDDMQVPIIYFGGRCSALKKANSVKNYLVKTEGIESNRIVTFYGGNNKVWKIVIYLVPVGTIDTESNTDSSKEQDCQLRRKKHKRRIKKTTAPNKLLDARRIQDCC
jgi:hypothetical protein